MDRNKRIVKNTIVFSIGNFGSKILSYIMVLVYTHYIGRSELGYYDLILTTTNLLHPLLLMAFDEGIYRWLIGEEYDKSTVISTCIKATGITTLFSITLLLILNVGFSIRYAELICLFVASSMMYSMFQNVIRGLTNNRLYAASGILNSLLILLFEVISLVILSLGIKGLLISKIAAYILTIVFIYVREPRIHGFIHKPLDNKLLKRIFHYSFPLVPNQISWWIVNSSDRYLILAFLGPSFNGIYSISNKFPTIITMLTGVVYFALQETIIKEYSSQDRDQFYSNIFKRYYIFLFSLVFCAIPSTNLIIKWFVSTEYMEASKFTGFLYLSTVFSALSSFLGIGYQISKETKRSVTSTILAAGVNILINVTLILKIGLHAASFSTFISYFFLFIIRVIHSKKYFTLHINWKIFVGLILGSFIFIITSYYGNTVVNIILICFSIATLIILNKSFIMSFFRKKQGV